MRDLLETLRPNDRAVLIGDTGQHQSIDAGRIFEELQDAGMSVHHLDHAYCMTSHAAQGVTVDRVLVHVDTGETRIQALINEILAYVALSRMRYDAQIFTDNEEQLAKSLSRQQQNSTALSQEEIERQPAMQPEMAI